MNVLALDLGSKTGYAWNDQEALTWGTLTLASKGELCRQRQLRLDRRGDCRVFRFQEWLKSLKPKFDFVVFEDVLFEETVIQCQLWASFRTTIWLTFPPLKPPIVECVPTSTLKKFATGHGKATKEMMIAAAKKLLKPEKDIDDNQADAIALWNWAQTNLCRTMN